MKRVLAVVAIVVAAVAVMAFGWYAPMASYARQGWDYVTTRVAGQGSAQVPAGTAGMLVASGTVEAETISVGSVSGGRIAAVYPQEGAVVAAGDLVAEMDTSALKAEMTQAEEAHRAALAQIELLRAGARDVDVAAARSAVTQAEVAAGAAQTAWQDAEALVGAPRELDVKIAAAEAQLRAAEQQVAAAQASATGADLQQALWQRTVKSLEEGFDVTLDKYPGHPSFHVDVPSNKLEEARLQWDLSSQAAWEAHGKLNAASADLEAARQSVEDLRAQRASPLSLEAQASSAAAAYRLAQAAIAPAQAQVDVILAGARAEQIAAAEAQARQAEAAVQAIQSRIDQSRITAPQRGVVTALVLRSGEVAAPGAAIMRLADQSRATLTVYVPEPDLSRVRLGQPLQVAVDSFPGRPFEGSVTYIADEAEFTPKNIQTRQERAKTVFAVRVDLKNPDGLLKAGMPADAYFVDGVTGDPSVAPQARVSTQTDIEASGTIEARDWTVAAELGGRVAAARAVEGDQVQAGQAMVELEVGDWDARHSQAQAAVDAARAELARVQSTARPADIAQAEAKVDQARAALAAAETELTNAQTLRDHPQELDAQINSSRMQVQSANTMVDLARARLKQAEVLQASLPSPGSDEDKTRRAIYDQSVLAGQAMLKAAEAQHDGAQATLERLTAIRMRPVGLNAAVHRAEGQVAQASAAVTTSLAALAQVQAPPQPEAVALAQARVAQAEASLALLEVQRTKMTVTSPVTGTVTGQMIHAGEVAQPGNSLYRVSDLSEVKLTIYVPTAQVGQVRIGQEATVTVDSYPGRTFRGKVSHVNEQAEYTPKNVQTEQERVRTVFGVEISLPNADGALKPGMPADVVLKSRVA